MDWASIEKNWAQVKGHFQTRWPKVMAADLDKCKGKAAEINKLIGNKYKLQAREVDKQLSEFLKTLKAPAK